MPAPIPKHTAPARALMPSVSRGPLEHGSPDYEASVQRILADREGRKTWPELEALENASKTDALARRALYRLETLNAATEYGRGENGADPSRVAGLLDASDRLTCRQGWGLALGDRPLKERLPLLKASKGTAGWRTLGYPPCVGRGIGPTPRGGMECPRGWDELVRGALRRQLRDGGSDHRLEEYRRLYQAHKKLQKGDLGARVSERSLFLDLKSLEEQILPEHLNKARGEAKTRFLGSREFERYNPQSEVRQFLGRLSALPEYSRERHLLVELSQIAHRGPDELGQYAAHVVEEIKSCPHLASSNLLPQFWKALARVSRMRTEEQRGERNLGTSESFNSLLTALNGDRNQNGAENGIELYRTGLTVNGIARNYTV